MYKRYDFYHIYLIKSSNNDNKLVVVRRSIEEYSIEVRLIQALELSLLFITFSYS